MKPIVKLFEKAFFVSIFATYLLLPSSNVFNGIIYPVLGIFLLVIIPFAVAVGFDYLELRRIKLVRNAFGSAVSTSLILLLTVLISGPINNYKYTTLVGGFLGEVVVVFLVLFVGFAMGFWIGGLTEKRLHGESKQIDSPEHKQ